MKEYIENTNKDLNKARLSNEITMMKLKYFEKDPAQGQTFNPDLVFGEVIKNIPKKFLEYIDTIVLGEFDFLNKRDLDALYLDGSIYLSNEPRDDLSDLIDDIIHETGHAVEKNNEALIYADGKIEKEFLTKRERLYMTLKENGFSEEADFYDFNNPEYDEQFDNFLYQEVGYPLLATLTFNDFCSPYGATSLREYFANCFEHYFYIHDPEYVKHITPAAASKIEELIEND
tara:strand:+ start:137 stop:829 length:693 start_codon:yes stop_codon:yes gene_type:complete